MSHTKYRTRIRNISIKIVLQECSGESAKCSKVLLLLRLSATYLISTVQKLHVKELSEKSGRPIEVQLPKSWCQSCVCRGRHHGTSKYSVGSAR